MVHTTGNRQASHDILARRLHRPAIQRISTGSRLHKLERCPWLRGLEMVVHHRRYHHASACADGLPVLPQSAARWREDVVDDGRRARTLDQQDEGRRARRYTAMDKGQGEENLDELAYLPPAYVYSLVTQCFSSWMFPLTIHRAFPALCYVVWNNGFAQPAMGFWLKSFNKKPAPVPGVSYTIPQINDLPLVTTAVFVPMAFIWAILSDGPCRGARWPFIYIGAICTVRFRHAYPPVFFFCSMT